MAEVAEELTSNIVLSLIKLRHFWRDCNLITFSLTVTLELCSDVIALLLLLTLFLPRRNCQNTSSVGGLHMRRVSVVVVGGVVGINHI